VLAVLECTVEHRLPGGDHEIVIGRMRHVETSTAPAAPLVFFRGGYASLRLVAGQHAESAGPRRPPTRRRRHPRPVNFGLGDVEAAGGDGRAKLDQNRAQMDLERRAHDRPSPGHHGHRQHPGQPLLP
jgi:hypothetical protein